MASPINFWQNHLFSSATTYSKCIIYIIYVSISRLTPIIACSKREWTRDESAVFFLSLSLVPLSLSLAHSSRIAYCGAYGNNLLTARAARREQYVVPAIEDGWCGRTCGSIIRNFIRRFNRDPWLTKTTRERARYVCKRDGSRALLFFRVW